MGDLQLGSKPTLKRRTGPRGRLDVAPPDKTRDRLGHRKQVGVMGKANRDIALLGERCLYGADRQLDVDPLLDGRFGGVIARIALGNSRMPNASRAVL